MAVAPNSDATTARTIITLALRDSGYLAIGQSAPGQIVNEALVRLNWIVAIWNKKRWLTWHLVDLSYIPTQAQLYYTVGPGGNFSFGPAGDFNKDFGQDFSGQSAFLRPAQVERAYSRITNTTSPRGNFSFGATGDFNGDFGSDFSGQEMIPAQLGGPIPTDYQLRLIPSYEDYSKITLKTQTNFPTHYFYDPVVPLGHIYFWPIPCQPNFEMHILVREPLQKFTTLDQQIMLPEEYAPALELNLALWLRRAAKMPPDPELAMMARDAVNTIRVNNTQTAVLDMPATLTRPSIYNVLADEWH